MSGEPQSSSSAISTENQRWIASGLIEALRHVQEGIVVCDDKGQVVHENEAGATWRNGRLGGNSGAEVIREVLDASSKGEGATRSMELLGPPRRSVTVAGFPISIDGRDGAVAVVHDTTSDRHLEAARRDFIANISHELKTPIGALGLLSETLMLEEDPTVAARLVERIHVETIRAGQVIDELLNLSRLEASRPIPAELLNAKSVVKQALSRVQYAADYRHIKIAVSGDEDATLFGGQSELVSAVHHLLENALKYSNEESSVEVDVSSQGDWTEIAVSDHGMGIAGEYLDRIFERFYRVDDARTGSTGGTGLGLSIVRHVVQNHGGEVRVTSREGEGSTFTLRLAAGPAAVTGRVVVKGGIND